MPVINCTSLRHEMRRKEKKKRRSLARVNAAKTCCFERASEDSVLYKLYVPPIYVVSYVWYSTYVCTAFIRPAESWWPQKFWQLFETARVKLLLVLPLSSLVNQMLRVVRAVRRTPWTTSILALSHNALNGWKYEAAGLYPVIKDVCAMQSALSIFLIWLANMHFSLLLRIIVNRCREHRTFPPCTLLFPIVSLRRTRLALNMAPFHRLFDWMRKKKPWMNKAVAELSMRTDIHILRPLSEGKKTHKNIQVTAYSCVSHSHFHHL